MAIVKLSGLPWSTAGVEVGTGVVKGVWLRDVWTAALVALGVTLGVLLGVALELMLELVPGVILAKEIFFCSGVWTEAPVADELKGVTEIWTGASVADELGGVTEV